MASTVIVGAGIIGLSTAYYLTKQQPGSTIHVVDSSAELFASASGYAGGFLIRSWFGETPAVGDLAALSFDEYRKLAERDNGRDKWEYSRVVALDYGRGAEGARDWVKKGASRAGLALERREADEGDVPAWLKRREGDRVTVVDSGDGTAVLDPLRFCRYLLDRCESEGVHVHYPATVLSVGVDVRDELAHVRIGYTDSSAETEIPASRILLAAGAWTPQVFESLFRDSAFRIPISSLAGHSLVIKKPSHTSSSAQGNADYMVFTPYQDGVSTEFCSRPNGVIFFAGVNSASIPLPALATGASVEAESLERLKNMARAVIQFEQGKDLEVVRQGVCFRPITQTGTPYITRLADEQLGGGIKTRPGGEGGVFVAAGHGPWGISQGLGTGLVTAELMGGKQCSVDISGLGIPQQHASMLPHGGDVFTVSGPS